MVRRQCEFACRLADHPFDKIDAENFLGHGMFDLKARIDLQEIGLLALHIIDEFNRTR